jgi:hypothetical protein
MRDKAMTDDIPMLVIEAVPGSGTTDDGQYGLIYSRLSGADVPLAVHVDALPALIQAAANALAACQKILGNPPPGTMKQ